jgi:hypothetical protein
MIAKSSRLPQENLALVIGETPWFAHAANLGHPELDGQPVYTVFYAEWLINVTGWEIWSSGFRIGQVLNV